MATKAEHDLVAAATTRRAENPKYRPTTAELKAVDQVLIEQARERLGITLQTLKNQFGVDIAPAEKLTGEALERWSEAAEDKVFEKEFKEFQSSLPSNQPDVLQQNPDPSLAEMLKASFEKMMLWIKSAGGSHKEIDTDNAEHYGAVVELDDMHCVQHMGKGIYSIHRLDELDNVPALNDPGTEIKYQNGRGTVVGKLGQIVER